MNMIEIKDESRLYGMCHEIIAPVSAEELRKIFEHKKEDSTRYTISGARTGIVGGAVPQGGILISTERLHKISKVENNAITVGAGVTLKELKIALAKERKLYFAPNPTEDTATMGGLFACDGAGGNSRKYGSIGDNTQAIEFITTSGLLWNIKRGEFAFDESGCNLPNQLRVGCDVYEKIEIIKALSPTIGMDLIDFIAGSEGALGTVTALTLQLKKKNEQWGILYFFNQTQEVVDYLDFLRAWDIKQGGIIEECEFFCEKTLKLLEEKKRTSQSLSTFPLFPENSKAAIMVILSEENEEVLEDILMEHFEAYCELGGEDANTWGFEGAQEIEKLHTLRHAVPELLNSEIDVVRQTMKQAIKIGTDFMGNITLMEYLKDLNGYNLNGFIFGHALDNHFHINILVSSEQELLLAKNLVTHWSTIIVESGGLLVVENGIGKIKADLVQSFLSHERLCNMKKIKRFFDPSNQLTSGTILT